LTDGNLELVQIVVSWMVTVPAVAGIIVYDERRLRGAALGRAWPPVSRDAAIFSLWNMGVHPLCVLIHFVRTRRNVRGALLGVGWCVAVLALGIGAQIGATALVEWAGL
jgi:hypothetical protein